MNVIVYIPCALAIFALIDRFKGAEIKWARNIIIAVVAYWIDKALHWL